MTEPAERWGLLPGTGSGRYLLYRQTADRTRPIVRLEVMEGMVTKGYRKGVYPRVTYGKGEDPVANPGLEYRRFPPAHEV